MPLVDARERRRARDSRAVVRGRSEEWSVVVPEVIQRDVFGPGARAPGPHASPATARSGWLRASPVRADGDSDRPGCTKDCSCEKRAAARAVYGCRVLNQSGSNASHSL